MLSRIKHFLTPTPENGQHPRFLRYEVLAGFLLVVAVLELGAIFSTTSFSRSLSASVLAPVIEQLTNDERAQNGEQILTLSATLAHAAQMKADDMAAHQYFAHTSPTGVEPWYWFKQAGYSFIYAGENLAIDFNDSDQVVDAWMHSPRHRENILKQEYTDIGIGVAQGMYEGHSTLYVVQFFGTPAPIAASSTATSSIASEVAAELAKSASVDMNISATTASAHIEHVVKHVSNIEKPSSVVSATIPVEVTATPTVAVVSVSSSSAAASHQTAGQVLGTETTNGAVAWMRVTFLDTILASPLNFFNHILIVMLVLFTALFVIALVPMHAEWLHRYAVANGAGAIGVLVFCIMFNALYASEVRIDTREVNVQQATAVEAVGLQ